MRKLASVQKIWKIEPIDGADRIELASVMGWKCVVPKGMYHIGENVVYFEIDSFLLVKPEYEFLRKSSYKKSEILGEGFRIKTQTMRGALSQGLVMKLGDLGIAEDTPVKTDLTKTLGVREWEITEKATDAGTIIGDLPYGVPKTNETRIQSEPGLLEEFRVTGHNYEYSDDGKSSFYSLIKKNDAQNRLRHYLETRHIGTMPVSIQGEFCAPGIQGNHLKLVKPEWYIFTVNYRETRANFEEVTAVAEALGFPTVPLEETGVDLPGKYKDVDALLERARGNYPNGGKKEGIVIRPTVPVFSNILSTWLSMKVINNEYIS